MLKSTKLKNTLLVGATAILLPLLVIIEIVLNVRF